jgi:hypothetical protein
MEDHLMATQTLNKTKARRKPKSQADNRDIKEAKSAEFPAGKLGLILERLAEKDGTTVEDLVKATGCPLALVGDPPTHRLLPTLAKSNCTAPIEEAQTIRVALDN